jgi:hypothetical protein
VVGSALEVEAAAAAETIRVRTAEAQVAETEAAELDEATFALADFCRDVALLAASNQPAVADTLTAALAGMVVRSDGAWALPPDGQRLDLEATYEALQRLATGLDRVEAELAEEGIPASRIKVALTHPRETLARWRLMTGQEQLRQETVVRERQGE